MKTNRLVENRTTLIEADEFSPKEDVIAVMEPAQLHLSSRAFGAEFTLTALFAAIVLVFNPVFPTFALSGKWVILLVSVLSFVASLVWMTDTATRTVVPVAALPQCVTKSVRIRSAV